MTGFHLHGSKDYQFSSSSTAHAYVPYLVCVCRPEDLNVLNSIREIQGALRIESWDHSSFPYLSNLEYIGCNQSSVLRPIDSRALSTAGCDIPNNPVALIIQGNLNLLSLDLSSLRQICGGSVVMFNNPQLCFVGDFDLFLSNSTQVTCRGNQFARDSEQCGNFYCLSLLLSLSFFFSNCHYP